MINLPGSGNHLVDNYEKEETKRRKDYYTLDCGCYKLCTCDEELEDEQYRERRDKCTN